MARLVQSRPPSAGTLASNATRPSSSQSTATNFSRPLSATDNRRKSTASSITPSTRPTSMASTMDMIAERDTPRQELKPGQLQSKVWKDKHGRFGGRWAYVLEKPKALYDTDSEGEEEKERNTATPEETAASRRRSKRISILSTMQDLHDSSEIRERPASRNVSGETLVSAENVTTRLEHDILDSALNMDWEIEKLPAPARDRSDGNDRKMKRQNSRLSMIGDAITSTISVLGKRGRQAIESGKDKLQSMKDDNGKGKRPCVTNIEEDEDEEEESARPAKKARVAMVARAKAVEITSTAVVAPHLHGWRRKRWLRKGLYMGQERDFDPRLNEARNKKKRASQGGATAQSKSKVLPLPMFRGEQLLESGHRDFKLPFDVYCPLPPGSTKPDTWGKFSTNRFVGDAADEWKHHKPLPPSKCLCTSEDGCDENCHNRFMLYECDDANCNVGAEFCGNRPFADLKERCKTGRKFDIGVEVVKTESKGFGVRACRTFEPGQIIVEYAGEIITQEECERRVATEYANNACYYLMTFDQNMIIDATRGSMARFINHSCEPNCHMVKWIVAGKPRMALFAGDDGVMTGEELTYDYNFDPFSQKNVQTCHCGAPSCRGFLGPKLTKPARTSRSASADDDNEQQSQPQQKKKSKGGSLLKRASVSLQNLLATSEDASSHASSSSTSRKRKSTGDMASGLEVNKKRRRNTDTNAVALLRNAAANDKRVSSTSTGGSTLVEESGFDHNKEPESNREVLARRNTIDALRGVAKTIKRNATSLRARASIRRAANKQKPNEQDVEGEPISETEDDGSGSSLKRVSRIPSIEKLVLDFGNGDEAYEEAEEEAAGMGRAAVFGETGTTGDEEHGEQERPGTANTVVGPGIVRSIKGSRRVAAAKRAGVTYGKRMGKSMRIVTNGTTRGE